MYILYIYIARCVLVYVFVCVLGCPPPFPICPLALRRPSPFLASKGFLNLLLACNGLRLFLYLYHFVALTLLGFIVNVNMVILQTAVAVRSTNIIRVYC
jgi:hypothetical protein